IGKVCKLSGNRIGLNETRVRHAQVIYKRRRQAPGIRKNDLTAVRGEISGKLRQRRVWVDVWTSLTIVKESRAQLVLAGIPICVDIEVVLSQKIRRSGLDGSDRNAHSADDFGRRIRRWRRRELLQDASPRVIWRESVQQRQALCRWRLLCHRCRRQSLPQALVSAIDEELLRNERPANVRADPVEVKAARFGQPASLFQIVPGVEVAVHVEAPGCAMPIIRARLLDDIELSPSRVSELCAKHIGYKIEVSHS